MYMSKYWHIIALIKLISNLSKSRGRHDLVKLDNFSQTGSYCTDNTHIGYVHVCLDLFIHKLQFPLSIRNPEATERPKFTKLMTAFLSNPSLLLKWTAKDLSVSPQASMLGAPLEEGRDLYQNLQFKYKDKGTYIVS